MRLPNRYLKSYIRKSVSTTRKTLTLTLALTLALPAFGGPKDPATPEQIAAHLKMADRANSPLIEYATTETRGSLRWHKETGLSPGLFVGAPKPRDQVITQEQVEIAKDLQEVLDVVKPGLLGTFAESANPYVKTKKGNTYNWNSLELSGIHDPENIKQLLDKTVAETGVKDIRIGLNLNVVKPGQPETFQPFINHILIPMWERGMFPIVTLDWFANLEMVKKTYKDGTTMHEFSFLNNPKFIEHREKLADMVSKMIFEAMDKFDASNPKEKSRIGFTLINETHTRAAFSRNFWEESQHSVNWSSPDLQRLYIPGLINVGRASVRMRAAIEKNRKGRLVVFYANEAMTPANYPTHEGYLRFAVLKLVMGNPVFSEANYYELMAKPVKQLREEILQKEAKLKAEGKTLNELDGMIKLFVFGKWNDDDQKQENAKKMLLSMLSRYQRDVQQLKIDYKITPRHRTIFGGDYYAQSEFIVAKPVHQLALERAKNQGEQLKRELEIRSDEDFVKALKAAAETAEKKTGVSIWNDRYTDRSKINFEKLLTAEDAIMMDLLVGFRYAGWELRKDRDLAIRQQRLGLDKSMDIFLKKQDDMPIDEYRADNFMKMLLANDAEKLRYALGLKPGADLMPALLAAANDTRDNGPILSISRGESLRDILNKDSRRILMRLFGLKNERFLGFLPPHYHIQINAGLRQGVGEILVDYAIAAGTLHVAILESGTPYYPWGADVHKQTVISSTYGARSQKFIMSGYHAGPWANTRGWAPGPVDGDLQTNGEINGSGIYEWVDLGNGKFEYNLVRWPGQEPWFQVFARRVNASLARTAARNEQLAQARALKAPANTEAAKASTEKTATTSQSGGGAKACRLSHVAK